MSAEQLDIFEAVAEPYADLIAWNGNPNAAPKKETVAAIAEIHKHITSGKLPRNVFELVRNVYEVVIPESKKGSRDGYYRRYRWWNMHNRYLNECGSITVPQWPHINKALEMVRRAMGGII